MGQVSCFDFYGYEQRQYNKKKCEDKALIWKADLYMSKK